MEMDLEKMFATNHSKLMGSTKKGFRTEIVDDELDVIKIAFDGDGCANVNTAVYSYLTLSVDNLATLTRLTMIADIKLGNSKRYELRTLVVYFKDKRHEVLIPRDLIARRELLSKMAKLNDSADDDWVEVLADTDAEILCWIIDTLSLKQDPSDLDIVGINSTEEPRDAGLLCVELECI